MTKAMNPVSEAATAPAAKLPWLVPCKVAPTVPMTSTVSSQTTGFSSDTASSAGPASAWRDGARAAPARKGRPTLARRARRAAIRPCPQGLPKNEHVFGPWTHEQAEAESEPLREGGDVDHGSCRQPPKLDRVVSEGQMPAVAPFRWGVVRVPSGACCITDNRGPEPPCGHPIPPASR